MRQANTSLGSIGKDLDSALKSGEAQQVTTPSNPLEVFQTGRMTSCQYLCCLPYGNPGYLGVLDAYSNWFTFWNCGYNTELKQLEKAGLLITVDSTTEVCTDASQSAVQKPVKQIQPPFDPSHLKMDWTGSRRIGPGLYNYGSTCFMNSVLQCLTYTPPLANYMFSKSHPSLCEITGFCGMCQFQQHHFQTQQMYQYGTTYVYPVAIVGYLPEIAPTFQFGKQEDSHEFLKYLIDAMQNGCLGNYPSRIPQEQIYTTVIHQIFGGQIRSQVTCATCKTKSDTFEPMLDLSLNIKGCSTLSDALRRATQPDILEGNNSYFCDKCKKKVAAEKILSIHSPPRVLTIHLKRFSFGPKLSIKLQTKISFPIDLDIRDYMTEKGSPVNYKLYGVLVHSGHTCNSGHYYCYVVAPNGTWHKMNDTYVSPVGQQQVQDSKAYILFYKMFTQTKPKSTSLTIQGLAPTQPTTFRSPSNQLPNMACTSFYRKQKRCSTEVLEENVKIAQRSKKTLPPESQTEETPNKKRKFEQENNSAKPASPVKLSRDEATLNETVTETKQKRSKTTKKRTKEKTDKLKLKTLKRVNHTEGQEREEHVLKALKNGIYGTRDELEEDLAAYVKQPYVKRRELAGVRR